MSEDLNLAELADTANSLGAFHRNLGQAMRLAQAALELASLIENQKQKFEADRRAFDAERERIGAALQTARQELAREEAALETLRAEREQVRAHMLEMEVLGAERSASIEAQVRQLEDLRDGLRRSLVGAVER